LLVEPERDVVAVTESDPDRVSEDEPVGHIVGERENNALSVKMLVKLGDRVELREYVGDVDIEIVPDPHAVSDGMFVAEMLVLEDGEFEVVDDGRGLKDKEVETEKLADPEGQDEADADIVDRALEEPQEDSLFVTEMLLEAEAVPHDEMEGIKDAELHLEVVDNPDAEALELDPGLVVAEDETNGESDVDNDDVTDNVDVWHGDKDAVVDALALTFDVAVIDVVGDDDTDVHSVADLITVADPVLDEEIEFVADAERQRLADSDAVAV
jgi:hypothetical protein